MKLTTALIALVSAPSVARAASKGLVSDLYVCPSSDLPLSYPKRPGLHAPEADERLTPTLVVPFFLPTARKQAWYCGGF